MTTEPLPTAPITTQTNPPTYEASQSDGFTQLSMRVEELGRQLDRYSQSIDDRLRKLEVNTEIKLLQQRNALHRKLNLSLVVVPRWDGIRPNHLPKITSALALDKMDNLMLQTYVEFYSEVAYPPDLSRAQMLNIIWYNIGQGPWADNVPWLKRNDLL